MLPPSLVGLFRVLRIVRMLKLLRHYRDADILIKAIHLSFEALLVPLFFLFLGAIFFGAAVFYFESIELQPNGDEDNVGTAAFPDVGTGIWFMIVRPARAEPAPSRIPRAQPADQEVDRSRVAAR